MRSDFRKLIASLREYFETYSLDLLISIVIESGLIKNYYILPRDNLIDVLVILTLATNAIFEEHDEFMLSTNDDFVCEKWWILLMDAQDEKRMTPPQIAIGGAKKIEVNTHVLESLVPNKRAQRHIISYFMAKSRRI